MIKRKSKIKNANIVYVLLMVGGFLLGWGYYQQHKNDFNYTQAVHRLNPSGSTNIVLWQYEGKPLKAGDTLLIKARSLYHGPRGRVKIVVYEDTDDDNVPDTETSSSTMLQFLDHVSWGEYRFKGEKPYKENLFIGLERPSAVDTFWVEKEEWTFTPLSARAFIRSPGSTEFVSTDYAMLSELLVTIPEKAHARAVDLSMLLYVAGFLVLAECIVLSIVKKVALFPYMALLVFIIVWRWLSAIAPTTQRWSGFFFPKMSPFWLWATTLSTVLLCAPSVACKVHDRVSRLFIPLRRYPRWLKLGAVFIVSLLAGWFFWTLRSNAIYGDGFGPLAVGYEYHNPLAVGTFDLFVNVMNHITHGKLRFQYFQVPPFSVFWGILFVLVLFALSREWGRNVREQWLIFFSITSLPALIQFFGYLEVYSGPIVLSLLVLYLFNRFFRRAASVVAVSTAAFFNYLYHLSTALLLPLVIIVWIKEALRETVGITLKRLLLTIFIVLFIWVQCLFLLLLLRYDFDLSRYEERVPGKGVAFLYGSTGKTMQHLFLYKSTIHSPHIYPLLREPHLSQTFAEWMFIGPMILPLFIILHVCYFKRIFSSARWIGLSITGWVFVATAFVLSPLYPYPKDWDLFALHSVVLQFIAVMFVIRFVRTSMKRYILFTLIVHQLLWTIPWIYFNHFCGVPLSQRFFGFH